MDGIYFLVIWIGSAVLHTVYELKVRPYLHNTRRKSNNRPVF
jgi:uncharacterized protein involved in type VI secretion and phage assembly